MDLFFIFLQEYAALSYKNCFKLFSLSWQQRRQPLVSKY